MFLFYSILLNLVCNGTTAAQATLATSLADNTERHLSSIGSPSSLPSLPNEPLIGRDPTAVSSYFQTLSPSPSLFLSDIPSDIPTTVPSSLSSQYPTTHRSFEPSSVTSNTPSLSPSYTPTEQCHDKPSYRSPLNFKCTDHRGTDCIQWRFLGLEIQQVVDLIHNCPISCSIDCGTMQSFEVTVSFEIISVTSFLAPSSVATLEAVSAEYLTNYIQTRFERSHFFLYEVELLKQNIVARRNLRSRARGLTSSTSMSLAVHLVFKAYGIGLDEDKIKSYLISGIDSTGYENSLQRSGDDAFIDIVVLYTLSNGVTEPLPIDRVESGRKRPAKGAAVTLSLLFAGALTAYILIYHRERCNCNLSKQIQVEAGDSVAASQVLSLIPSIGQVLSSGHSNGDSATHDHSSSSSESTLDDASQGYQEHPLTGIIPPMILYENIDEGSYAPSTTQAVLHNVVPSKSIKASPMLIAQFRSGTVTIDESMLFIFPRGEESSGDSKGSDIIDRTPRSIHEESNSDKSVSSLPPGNFNSLESGQDMDLNVEKPKGSRRSISFGELGRPPSIPGRRAINFRPRMPLYTPIDGSSPPYQNSDVIDTSCKDQFELTKGHRKTLSAPPGHGVAKHINSFLGLMPPILGQSPGKRLKVSSPIADANPRSTSSGGQNVPDHHLSRCVTSDSSRDGHAKRVRGSKLTFQVPRYGKLGIEITFDPLGPIIQQVKDYSPLLGKAKIGDRIISIDGTDTHNSTSEEISILLAKDRNSMWLQSSAMNIVFLRERRSSRASEEDASRFLVSESAEAAAHGELAHENNSAFADASQFYKRRFILPVPQRGDLSETDIYEYEEHVTAEGTW